MRTKGTADDWYAERETWQGECRALREIVKACGLDETVKWGQPCYTDGGRNVLIVSALKDCATLNFFKGALLADPLGLLEVPGENSRSARYLKVHALDQVEAKRAAIQALVAQAVEVERAGLSVPRDQGELELVAELQARLDADPALRAAFQGLTPGRQRAYNILIGGAKTPKGRAARVESHTARILLGKGPNDCICGHSRRPPGCDGSHKHFA